MENKTGYKKIFIPILISSLVGVIVGGFLFWLCFSRHWIQPSNIYEYTNNQIQPCKDNPPNQVTDFKAAHDYCDSFRTNTNTMVHRPNSNQVDPVKGIAITLQQYCAMNLILEQASIRGAAIDGFRMYFATNTTGSPNDIIYVVGTCGLFDKQDFCYQTSYQRGKAGPCPDICDTSSPLN